MERTLPLLTDCGNNCSLPSRLCVASYIHLSLPCEVVISIGGGVVEGNNMSPEPDPRNILKSL